MESDSKILQITGYGDRRQEKLVVVVNIEWHVLIKTLINMVEYSDNRAICRQGRRNNKIYAR